MQDSESEWSVQTNVLSMELVVEKREGYQVRLIEQPAMVWRGVLAKLLVLVLIME